MTVLASSVARELRESKAGIKHIFYNLTPEVTYSHLSHIILVTQASIDTMDQETPRGMECQKAGITSTALETGHHT